MKLPLQITSRNVSLSEAAGDIIKEKAAKLETFYDRIIACRVLVDAPHRHKHQGVFYNVRLDITVPGGEIVVKREPNEDLYVAIRDSFDAARRQLQSFVRRQRGEVKIHDTAPSGQANDLPSDLPGDLQEAYGVIETIDGREVYFHGDSVNGADGFDPLAADAPADARMQFIEEEGEERPQASAVRPRAGRG